MSTIQRTFAAIGIVSNFLLMNLIVFRSPKDLGLYKYLMIYISCFELVYGALEFSIVPDLFSLDSAFFVILNPDVAYLPRSWLQVADLIYCGFFSVSLVIFGCQFAYRYQVLKGNSYWTACKPSNFFLWIGSSIASATFYSVFVQIFMGRNEYTEKMLRDVNYPNSIEIGFLGFIFHPKLANGTEIINWDSIIGASVTTSTLIISEFLMLYYAFKCFQSTKSLINQSSNYRRLQWQLFYALVAQTIIPILFMQIPMSLTYISTLVLNSSVPWIGHMQGYSISVYLATDALPTIFIIRQYRDTVLMCFRKNSRVGSGLHGTDSSKNVYMIHV